MANRARVFRLSEPGLIRRTLAVHVFGCFRRILAVFRCFRHFSVSEIDPAPVEDSDTNWPILTLSGQYWLLPAHYCTVWPLLASAGQIIV